MFLLARREGLSDNVRKVFGFALMLLRDPVDGQWIWCGATAQIRQDT